MLNRIVSIRRHCKKGKDGLSPEGIEQAREIGKNLEIPLGGIIGYHSSEQRTRDTFEYMMEGAGIENAMVYPADFGRGNLLDNIFKVDPAMKKDDWPSDMPYSDAVKYCLEKYPETMRAIHSNIDSFITKLMDRDTFPEQEQPLLFEALTHGPNIEAFLYHTEALFFHASGGGKHLLSAAGYEIKEGQNILIDLDSGLINAPHLDFYLNTDRYRIVERHL